MKNVVFFLSASFLLQACAKVSQLDSICNPKPSKPIMYDTFVIAGSYNKVITAQHSANTDLIWVNPYGNVQFGPTISLNSGSNGYGQYKVMAYGGDCASDTTYFQVFSYNPGRPGTPPCPISNPNSISINGNLFTSFTGNASTYSSSQFNHVYASNSTYSMNIEFSPYIHPTSGYAYQIDAGTAFTEGSVAVFLQDPSFTTDYYGYSGYVYVTSSGGHNYVVFCDAVFQTGSGAVTLSGSIQF